MRRLRMVLKLLVLGALSTVAIAFAIARAHGCATQELRPVRNPYYEQWDELLADWNTSSRRVPTDQPPALLVTSRFGHEIVSPSWRLGYLFGTPQVPVAYPRTPWWPRELMNREGDHVDAVACGWPCLALSTWRTVRPVRGMNGNQARDIEFHWGLVYKNAPFLPSTAGQFNRFDSEFQIATVLPLRPIWPGFVVNTLLCAAILWVLIYGHDFVRGRMRWWRGRCPRCGYPCGQSTICSECGATLKPAPQPMR